MYNMTEDIDTFAEDTGYEGTFTNREFLFPIIQNNTTEKYDQFDPYDEEECIVAGTMVNKNIYGTTSDHNSDTSDPFGDNGSTFEPTESSIREHQDRTVSKPSSLI